MERDAPRAVSLDVERRAESLLGVLRVVPTRGHRVVQQRDVRRDRERADVSKVDLGPAVAGGVLLAERGQGELEIDPADLGETLTASGRNALP